MMKVLVVGGGGREHVLVWKLAQSPLVTKVYAAPGNPGIAQLAACVPLRDHDIDGLLRFARAEGIDLTVVGPEQPLVRGIVDRFQEAGLAIFGPTAAGAQIEGSKSFAKRLMQQAGIPTATAVSFHEFQTAWDYAKQQPLPLVIKADGLAAGKGVTVCQELSQVEKALQACFREKVFGSAGESVLIEECLVGEELSLLAFTDGKSVLPLVPAQDHKAIFDGDRGPNTGGMGAYSPVPQVDAAMITKIKREILEPMVAAMHREGILYRGILYAGLMLTKTGPKVIEFNCRFGDPEAQVVLPRLETDLVMVMQQTIAGKLDQVKLTFRPEAAVCVVMASQGYPGSYAKGVSIEGLEAWGGRDDLLVFHAGTAERAGRVVTSGGRVLGVTALASDIAAAQEKAYQAVKAIHWEGAYFRTDIAYRALHVA